MTEDKRKLTTDEMIYATTMAIAIPECEAEILSAILKYDIDAAAVALEVVLVSTRNIILESCDDGETLLKMVDKLVHVRQPFLDSIVKETTEALDD